jgi:hypothetical protein
MESILDRNNSHDEKSIKQTNLEREKIMSQRETGETREYYGTFIPFTKLRSIQWIT